MDMNLFHSLWTVVVLVTFIGIIVWAWSKNRLSDFDEAAQLPLEDEHPLATKTASSEHPHV